MFCVNEHLAEIACDNPTAWLVLTRQELEQMRSPFYLDVESAVLISSASLLLLAVAFVIRVIRKQLETTEKDEP